MLVAPVSEEGANDASNEVDWVNDALCLSQHFLFLLLYLQLYLLFVLKNLELGAFGTAQHLHRRRVSVQRLKQLVILHLVKWLGHFVL